MTQTTLIPQSTKTHLRFISFQPDSYAGLHEGMSLVYFFEDDKPIVGFEGDQGVGKTSSLKCLHYLMGGPDAENAINSIDNNKKASLVFEVDGVTYEARTTRSGFTLSTLTNLNGKQVKSEMKRPREIIESLIGNVGISPMFLKQKDGKAQIEWVRGITQFTPEQLEMEQRINSSYLSAYNRRTAHNRNIKRLKALLTNTGLYKWNTTHSVLEETGEYKQQKLRYNQDVTAREKEVTEKFNEVNARHNEHLLKQQELNSDKNIQERTKSSILNKEQQIVGLRQQISALEDDIRKLDADYQSMSDKIAASEKFIEENNNVVTELATAKEAFANMGAYRVSKKEFEDRIAVKAQFDTEEEAQKKADAELLEYQKKMKEFVQLITPDIQGLEVCVPRNIDVATEREIYLEANPEATDDQVTEYIQGLKPDTREGLYYKGRSVAQLSESELWELCLNLWAVQKVQVVLVENITDLGTDAIKTINKFCNEKGGKMFYSAMERGVEKLQVTFHSEIKLPKKKKAEVDATGSEDQEDTTDG